MEDLAVFQAAEEAALAGRAVVLATIVHCRGSVPRGAGSKMLVDPERGLTGTVGGGCGEAQVIEAAAARKRLRLYGGSEVYDANPLDPNPVAALALEMALHEETERAAMEGELGALEAMWRDAESIAAIADGLAAGGS